MISMKYDPCLAKQLYKGADTGGLICASNNTTRAFARADCAHNHSIANQIKTETKQISADKYALQCTSESQPAHTLPSQPKLPQEDSNRA